MQKKRVLLFGLILGLVLAAALAWWVAARYVFENEKTVYTVADFPNAGAVVTDPNVVQERVALINQWYAEMQQPEADVAYNYTRIGILKKTLQDYTGAEDAWLRALALNKSSVNYGNLANLYYLELNEPQKAIDYYERAITVNPTGQTFYEDLAGVYRYKLGNDAAAIEAIMLEGAKNNPGFKNNFYLYLVDYYDREGQNLQKKQSYIDLIMSGNPDEVMLEYLRGGGYISE